MTRAHSSVLSDVVKTLNAGLGLAVDNADPENPTVSFDLNINDLEEGNTLVWDESSQKFVPGQSSGSGSAIGDIKMRFGALDDGYISWGEGGSFDRAVYPDLAAWYDLNGSFMGMSGPQIAAGEIPDWRDYVPRTAGGTLGPTVGAKQEDAMQRITGELVLALSPLSAIVGSGIGALNNGPRTDTRPANGTGNGTGLLIFDSATSPGARVSDDETRVKSFGVRWQIKAYGAFVNEGTADLVAIEQAVNDLENNAYTKQTVLGTVSQIAGVPTGAIIERGSNANGEYVRFADGTQICYGVGTLSFSSQTFLQGTAVLPAPFIDVGYRVLTSVVLPPANGSRAAVWGADMSSATTSTMTLAAWGNTGVFASGVSMTVHFFVIGRWF